MKSLPRALEPWRSSLEKLAPDLLAGLSPLVRRLALAVGPYPAASRRGDGEPDGYDGLARRGRYERLLATEWLLASELPDEFLRRASSGEHAFLQLARKVPSGGRRSLALFDIGPSQLGTPRVLHLAALIVLAHRAERAGVAFSWGLLQRPWTVTENVSEASVRQLLAETSPDEPQEIHRAAWLSRHPDDEMWIVGSPPLANLAVEDVLEPGVRRVAVSVPRGGARLMLELPDDGDCTRLLRDPFRVAVAAPRERPLPARPVGNPLFTPDGRRLILGLANGSVALLPIPTSPRMAPGRPGIFVPDHERLVAAGGGNGQLWVATVGGEAVALYRLGKRGGIARRQLFHPKVLPAPGPPFGTLVVGESYTFTDKNGLLFHVAGGEITHEEAAALTLDGNRPIWIEAEGWRDRRKRISVSTEHWSWQRLGPTLGGTGPAEAFFCVDFTYGLLAAVRRDSVWEMVRVSRPEPHVESLLHPSGHALVVGALQRPASLVLLDEGRRSLSVVSRNFSRVIAQSSREIASATVAPRGTHIAWLSDDGELTVLAVGSREIVLRMQ